MIHAPTKHLLRALVCGASMLLALPALAADGCAVSTAPADVALLKAALSKDFAGAITALETGADVNARDSRCNTPLIWAVRSDSANITAELLAREAAFFAVNADGKSALDYAAAIGGDAVTRIDDAVASFKQRMRASIESGSLYAVLSEYQRRSLGPDLLLTDKDSAIALAAQAVAADEGELDRFVNALLERGASVDWAAVARAAATGKHLGLLKTALRHVAPSPWFAMDIGQDDGGAYLSSVLEVLIDHRDENDPLESWLSAVTRLADPTLLVARLEQLVKPGQPIGDVGWTVDNLAYEFDEVPASGGAKGAALEFLLSHGAALQPNSRILNHLMGSGHFAQPMDLQLVELALDAGARADAEENFSFQSDMVSQLFLNLFDESNKDASYDPGQLARVLRKLLKAGGELDPTARFGQSATDPVTRVLQATTQPELQKPLLALLSDLKAKPPRICELVGKASVDGIIATISFKAFSAEQQWGGFECAASIGRELPGAPRDRRRLLAAMAEARVSDLDAALAREIDRLSSGGGDIESVKALLVSRDEALAGSDSVVAAMSGLKSSIVSFPDNQAAFDQLLSAGLRAE